MVVMLVIVHLVLFAFNFRAGYDFWAGLTLATAVMLIASTIGRK